MYALAGWGSDSADSHAGRPAGSRKSGVAQGLRGVEFSCSGLCSQTGPCCGWLDWGAGGR
jgi:hypothetical protein